MERRTWPTDVAPRRKEGNPLKKFSIATVGLVYQKLFPLSVIGYHHLSIKIELH